MDLSTIIKKEFDITSALKTLVKNRVKESFDITFMGNEKSYQKINCFFFSHIYIYIYL